MGKGKKLVGVPWHVEIGDKDYERVRRTWCGHYDLKTNMCKFYGESCKTNEACSHFWLFRKPKEQDIPSTEIELKCRPFDGVKYIRICDVVNERENEPVPDGAKNKILDYFLANNYIFQYPIAVDCVDGKYILRDFFKIFAVAKGLGLTVIQAQMYVGVRNKELKKYKVAGKQVHHKKYGIGKIISIENNFIEVLFRNGVQCKLDLVMCIKNHLFI